MQRRIDRRTFLKQSAAVTGGLAVSLGISFPVFATPGISRPTPMGAPVMTWYALDPEWGAGLPGCPVDPSGAHTSTHSCHACNSCHHHGENKLFPTQTAADTNRAHLGCKCLVVEGGDLPADVWEELFGSPDNIERPHVDRRWDWVAAALDIDPDDCDLGYAHPAIEATWARTDKPVVDGNVSRTWMWGPTPFTCGMTEQYSEAPGGERLVQYFDKSRMEITDPGGDQSSIWFVTNGLLVVELISGSMQVGHNEFMPGQPATENVAGDADDPDGPTYATFSDLLDGNPLTVGATIIQRVNRTGVVSDDPSLAEQGIMAGHFDEITGHSVAAPFWQFMNSSGPVYENGGLSTGNLFPDPVFATGRPITEAYWAQVKVAGTVQLVLMQCFERRCLTYTPQNDPAWRVEAGNVGQHYYAWRYPT